MAHHPSEATLSRYADGDLPKLEKAGVAAHLAGCASCRRKLAELREIKNTARGLQRLEVPPALLAGIRTRIETRTSSRRGSLLQGIILGGALAAAVLAVVVFPHFEITGSGQERIVLEPASQPLGPHLDLAEASSFAVDTALTSVQRESEAYNPTDGEPQPSDTLPRVVLIPLDEEARRHVARSRLRTVGFLPERNGCQAGKGEFMTVAETSYR